LSANERLNVKWNTVAGSSRIRRPVTIQTKAIWSGLKGRPAIRLGLAAVLIAGGAVSTQAQDLSTTGTAPLAVQGISQPGKFPIKITKSGSYRLNGNVTVKAAGVDAIDVLAPNVKIDMSGFTISGAAIAINTPAGNVANTTVTNGVISASQEGIALGEGSLIRGLRISGLSGSGAVCGAIFCTKDCTISDNTTNNNALCVAIGAITTGANSVITGNTANGNNGGSGIEAETGSVVRNNTTNGNSLDGIGVGSNALVAENTSTGNSNNGVTAAGTGVLVSHNTLSGNSDGIDFIGPGAYTDNVMLNNTTADVQGGTSLAGGNTNLCTGAVCGKWHAAWPPVANLAALTLL
jgi:hypothetical protein